MNIEIEKKFLVKDWFDIVDSIPKYKPTKQITQFYLSVGDKSVSRVRIIDNKDAKLCIKSKTLYERDEFEYDIPLADAERLSQRYSVFAPVNKLRHYVDFEGHIFEIDEFLMDNYGLVVAELELKDINETYTLPSWIGKDVTSYTDYYNFWLAQFPYKNWGK